MPQQQSLILHLLTWPHLMASALSKTEAWAQAALMCPRWGAAGTSFISDPNPGRTQEQLLSSRAVQTGSALTGSASEHNNKLWRGHGLATVHVRLCCTQHQASTGSLHLRWFLPSPQPSLKRWQCQPSTVSHWEDKNIAKIPLPPWNRKHNKHKSCRFSHSLRKQHWKPAL